MYHFDIPKTRQYDTGKIEVIARNSAGEAITATELQIVGRKDDYRGVLKNSPRRKFRIYKTDIHKYFTPYFKYLLINNNIIFSNSLSGYIKI